MGLGWKLWLSIIGLCVAGAFAAALLFLIIGWAWYAWGLIGMFLFFAVILLAIGWITDKRQERLDRELAV